MKKEKTGAKSRNKVGINRIVRRVEFDEVRNRLRTIVKNLTWTLISVVRNVILKNLSKCYH